MGLRLLVRTGFILDQPVRRTVVRSAGGHRRYSRYQQRIAARARELVDHGEAACRTVILEGAQRINAECRRAAESEDLPTAA
ncbi:hypothetical protein [Streptomyces microflavus]|uniref:hypothetical protein n=1 Tax=Streptomyces microflavus TaxID=1919 RepID=UPI00382D7C07